MSQRAYVELTDRGHEVDIHLTSTQEEMVKAVEVTKPELIIAFTSSRLRPDVKGRLMPTMKQLDRKINWRTDSTEVIVRKIRSADSNPGVLDIIFGEEYYLYGAHSEDFHKGEPERILGYRDDAILIR